MPGSCAIASEAVVAVELGREMGSRVGSGAAKPSLPSSMVNLIGGRMDVDIRVGTGAIGAIAGRLSARAAAMMDAVADKNVSRGNSRLKNEALDVRNTDWSTLGSVLLVMRAANLCTCSPNSKFSC
jgi:hypothetical protein